jgi:hypothetical protein
MLQKFFRSIIWGRILATLILGVGGAVLPAVDGSAADTGMLHLRCTNPTSGFNWPVVVDLDHNLVDSQSASISDGWISWHNPSGGTYELERATGKLQLRAASSTGGFFLYYTCKPE